MEEVLSKYFSGEASQSEVREIEDWRSESKENASAFMEAKVIWSATLPKEEANQAVLASILYNDTTAGVPEVIPLWNQKLFRVAAAVVLLLGLIFTVIKQSETKIPYGEVVSATTTYELPDGSIATLHTGASLDIGDFKESRSVELNGKAFFDVKPDPTMPFIVNTEKATVRVLGTSFLVDAPNDANAVELMVSTGKVSFIQNAEIFGSKPLSLELKAGESGQIKAGEKGIRKKNIKDQNHLAWKTKQVAFKNSSLTEVSNILQDMYDEQFVFEQKEAQSCQLNATFDNKSATEVANILALTFDFEVEKRKDGFLFKGEGCK